MRTLALVSTLLLGTSQASVAANPSFAVPGIADPPKVVSLEPENDATDVDFKKVTHLVVTFDRPMDPGGWSFCGGGKEMKGNQHWEDGGKRIVADVELEPDHAYHFLLNCPAASNFKSKEGVALVPTQWSFTTAPEKVADPAKQKAENKKSFDELKKVLAESYSHYDLRVKAWDKLYHDNEAAILGAKSAAGWAAAVGKMLGATEDIHMYLRLGDKTFAAGKRAIDPLFRQKVLSQYVSVQPMGEHGLQGRTAEGIAYVMIPAWEDPKQIDIVEQALSTMRDCKAIVVDVRPNSGGDELLAQRIAAWFVDGTKVYARDRFRVKSGKNGFGPTLDRAVTGNTDAAKRIDVPIAVLTSRYVMSSNESFVMMMKQAKDCTVVGQPTYGSSGCPKPHDLPNGVTIIVPSWQDLRLDGTCFEGEGLAPDVEVKVETKQLENGDPILDKALEVLRSKMNKTGK